MSLTKVTYSMILGAPVNVLDFGADPTGSADSGAAFQNAIDSITDDNVLVVPDGTYKISQQLTLGLANTGARLVGIGKPTLIFEGLSNSTDCIVLNPNPILRQVELSNFTIDCDSVGRDAVVLKRGDYPIVNNVSIVNSYRDGFSISCSDNDWVENGEFQILLTSCGRHGITMNLSGSTGAFINECLWWQIEVRGVSKVTAGGHAVYCTSTASGAGAKISNHLFLKSNFDANYSSGPAPSNNVVEADSGAIENWRFICGGWENTLGTSLAGGYAVAATGTATWNGLTIDSIIWNVYWGNAGIDQTIVQKFIFDFSFNKVQFDGNVGVGVDPTVAVEILKATPQIRLKGTGTTSNVIVNSAYGGIAKGSIGTSDNAPFMIHTYNVERLKFQKDGGVVFIPLSGSPTSPEKGEVYFDSGLNKLRCWDGTTWNDLF